MASIHMPTNYVKYVFYCEHCGKLNGPQLVNLLGPHQFAPADGMRKEIVMSSYEMFKGKCASCGCHQSWEGQNMKKRFWNKLIAPIIAVAVVLVLALFNGQSGMSAIFLFLGFCFIVWGLIVLAIEGVRYLAVSRDMNRATVRNKVLLYEPALFQ